MTVLLTVFFGSGHPFDRLCSCVCEGETLQQVLPGGLAVCGRLFDGMCWNHSNDLIVPLLPFEGGVCSPSSRSRAAAARFAFRTLFRCGGNTLLKVAAGFGEFSSSTRLPGSQGVAGWLMVLPSGITLWKVSSWPANLNRVGREGRPTAALAGRSDAPFWDGLLCCKPSLTPNPAVKRWKSTPPLCTEQRRISCRIT